MLTLRLLESVNATFDSSDSVWQAFNGQAISIFISWLRQMAGGLEDNKEIDSASLLHVLFNEESIIKPTRWQIASHDAYKNLSAWLYVIGFPLYLIALPFTRLFSRAFQSPLQVQLFEIRAHLINSLMEHSPRCDDHNIIKPVLIVDREYSKERSVHKEFYHDIPFEISASLAVFFGVASCFIFFFFTANISVGAGVSVILGFPIAAAMIFTPMVMAASGVYYRSEIDYFLKKGHRRPKGRVQQPLGNGNHLSKGLRVSDGTRDNAQEDLIYTDFANPEESCCISDGKSSIVVHQLDSRYATNAAESMSSDRVLGTAPKFSPM